MPLWAISTIFRHLKFWHFIKLHELPFIILDKSVLFTTVIVVFSADKGKDEFEEDSKGKGDFRKMDEQVNGTSGV